MSTLNHATATTIVLRGLSLCCFNSANTRWEVAFLRYPKTAGGAINPRYHQFFLKIQKKGAGTTLLAPMLIEGIQGIEFSFTNAVNQYGTFTNGFFTGTTLFDRKAAGGDPDDFRWVLDLNDTALGLGAVSLKTAGSFDNDATLAIAHIPNAVFYANRSEAEMFLQDEATTSPPTAPAQTIGRINGNIKGDVFIDTGGSIEIKLLTEGGLTIPISLPASSTERYIITLGNLEPPAVPPIPLPDPITLAHYIKGDLGHVSDVLNVATKKHLWGPPRNSTVLGARTDCEGYYLSGINTFS